MNKEEEIQQKLLIKFPYLDGKIRIQRVRRIFVNVPSEKIDEVLNFADQDLNFSTLCTISGLDEGATLGFIYHLARADGIILNLSINVPKENPVINTVKNRFPNSIIYERELVDLLGAKVQGLPEGPRYPLTDDWPAGLYPLRKDQKKEQ